MAFTKRIWSKGNIVKAEHLNRYEEALESHDQSIVEIEQLKATKTELADAVAPKADKTYVDEQDALKATKVELADAVAPLAEKTYVDEQLGLKADKVYVDAQDALKATKTELTAIAALKADKTYVDGLNEVKATKEELTTGLAPKAFKSYVDAQDALKADKTYVDAEDAKRATKVELAAAVAQKADKTYVDSLNSVKATKTELEAAIADKAQKTYVDGHVNLYKNQLEERAREVQYLQPGLNVLNADVATPVDIEIEGRTLTSMANSNLEADKHYVLADPKTKVVVDKKTIGGIGKFQKATTSYSFADFSDTNNTPHIAKAVGNGVGIFEPEHFAYQLTGSTLERVGTLDNDYYASSGTNEGSRPQHLFSFDVVAEIEKNIGSIPLSTREEKVSWVRSNVDNIRVNWYGYGNSHTGNKASFTTYAYGAWGAVSTHTYSTSSTRIGTTQAGESAMLGVVQDDGFAHFLTYAEPSDGITPSTMITNYVSFETTLKPTAQLNTRGKIIRVENFEGKVKGSYRENPHKSAISVNSTQLQPVDFSDWLESNTAGTSFAKLDGEISTSNSYPLSLPDAIPQQIFSFNLVESVERNVGKIPAPDNPGKVAWIKENVSKLTPRWYGYGGSALGNKATLKAWWVGGDWSSSLNTSHSEGSVSELSFNMRLIPSYVDSEGFSHFIAYSDPSDGKTKTFISTDYIELEIELKPTADFSAPKVPLYEVTKEEYDKIGIQWDDAEVKKRFPAVVGTQHVTNPYLVAEGENLLPPLTEWTKGFGDSVVEFEGPYKIKMSASAGNTYYRYYANCVPGQTYSQGCEKTNPTSISYMYFCDANKNRVTSSIFVSAVAPSNAAFVEFIVNNNSVETTFENPILTISSEPKPFVPRNPSYLQVQEKLGAIEDKKDVLFKEDGKWKVRKQLAKLTLTGSMDWSYNSPHTNAKTVRLPAFTDSDFQYFPSYGVSHFGNLILPAKTSMTDNTVNMFRQLKTDPNAYFTLSNRDTGWGSQSPNSADVKRYFNGWKYTDGTTWTSVTGNGQTATAQVALDTQPMDYTPYKLSYVLATPVVEEIAVEGDIVADGLTQVEVGSGIVVREKAVAGTNKIHYFLNHVEYPSSKLSNKLSKFIGIYKNGLDDTGNWYISPVDGYGSYKAYTEIANFDTTAEYTVTYIAENIANTSTNTKALFSKNIRSAHDDLAVKSSDNATLLSVHEKAIVDMYVRLKALEAN